jgi:hypothetical protein
MWSRPFPGTAARGAAHPLPPLEPRQESVVAYRSAAPAQCHCRGTKGIKGRARAACPSPIAEQGGLEPHCSYLWSLRCWWQQGRAAGRSAHATSFLHHTIGKRVIFLGTEEYKKLYSSVPIPREIPLTDEYKTIHSSVDRRMYNGTRWI